MRLAGLADVAGIRQQAARLADDRVELEIAGELVRPAEAPDVAHESDQAGRRLEPDARDREEPPDPPIVDDRPGDPGLGEADLGFRAIKQPEREVDELALVNRSSTDLIQDRPWRPNGSLQGQATRFRMRRALIRLRSLVRSATRAARPATRRRSDLVAGSGCQTIGR